MTSGALLMLSYMVSLIHGNQPNGVLVSCGVLPDITVGLFTINMLCHSWTK